MKRLLLAWAIAASMLWLTPAALQGQGTSACRPTDSTSVRLVQWVSSIVTGTDAAALRQRSQMKLPRVSASEIAYVTDNRVCSKAVSPYNTNAGMGSVAPSGKLYVIKVGTLYLANDPVKSAGEFTIFVTLDSKFRFLASSLG
jgi:hypothetical protein